MKIDNNVEFLGSALFNPGSDKKVDGGVSDTFDDFYRAALDVVNETSLYQNQADQIQQDFITGRSDNMIAVMMAQEKAYSSLQFTVQVTNKIVEAYREIMRIQL